MSAAMAMKSMGAGLGLVMLGACVMFQPSHNQEDAVAERRVDAPDEPTLYEPAPDEPAPPLVRSMTASTPLILDPAVPQTMRQAAACHAFNLAAPRYLVDGDVPIAGYGEEAAFWLAELEAEEPDPARRELLLASAREQMAEDFPLLDAAEGGTQFRNADFAGVLLACGHTRVNVENADG